MGFIVAFYPIRKIFIWSTMIQIYFLTFVVQQINTIKGKITTFHWRFRANRIWYLERSDWKSSSIISSALSLIMISVLSLCECITRSSSLLLEDIKLIAIVKWIFHVSDILRSFISFKYGLILLRYYQLIVPYFYHYYFHIQYNCCSKNYLLFLVCNNLLFLVQKGS